MVTESAIRIWRVTEEGGDLPRIRPSIYHVTNANQDIVVVESGGREQRAELVKAPVDVSTDDRSGVGVLGSVVQIHTFSHSHRNRPVPQLADCTLVGMEWRGLLPSNPRPLLAVQAKSDGFWPFETSSRVVSTAEARSNGTKS